MTILPATAAHFRAGWGIVYKLRPKVLPRTPEGARPASRVVPGRASQGLFGARNEFRTEAMVHAVRGTDEPIVLRFPSGLVGSLEFANPVVSLSSSALPWENEE